MTGLRATGSLMMKEGVVMNCRGEIQQLMVYVRSTVSGAPVEFDVIDQRAIRAALRQPLDAWLLKLSLAGCKIRGTRGNMPRDLIDLIESVRVGLQMSKQELARRSGVSRGHVQELLADPEPRPHVETVVRLAVGLDFPLEVIGIREDRLDDADPAMPGHEGATRRTEGSGWQQATTFGTTMFGGSVLPMLFGGQRAAYAGLGLIGAATIGIGLRHLEAPRPRETACFIGAGLVAAAVFGLIRGARGGTTDAT